MNVCPHCRHENLVGVLSCSDCGEMILARQSAKTLRIEYLRESVPVQVGSQVLNRSEHFGPNNRLVIHFHQDDRSLVLQPIRPLTFGRVSPNNLRQPTVDLTSYDGRERGVSRLHASIACEKDQLIITDLGSVNGTFVNGYKLRARESVTLHDGDTLQLGQLKLYIYFM